ncbi:MAG: type II secretion system ATPase GspE [Deltaproteobacteria bacterium]|nr:type II secretion system ATPase GspE [Deltaproteobacteria bacterium]
MAKRRRLGELLLERSALTPEQLAEGLRIQRERGGRIGEILLEQKVIREGDLLEALGAQLGVPVLHEIPDGELDPQLTARVPITFAKKHSLLPLRRDGLRILAATADPCDLPPLDDLAVLLGAPVSPLIAPPRAILTAINRVYERGSEAGERMGELDVEALDAVASELEEPQDLLEAADEAPVIKFVNSLLFQAVKDRASDIHVEPFERELAIRYRIDGMLYQLAAPPRRFHAPIVARIKVMAGLDIAEKRLPQDGRIKIKIAGRDIDIRISIVPTAFGERVVLRLLDKLNLLLDLEQIGFAGDRLKHLLRLIQRPNGILLVTGPTGSGKTTTLYAALSRINSPEKNIITIEDPIEYQLMGVGQIPVTPKVGLTFANGLRSILRQDPDIIMVGEIRDPETAEIAIHASLTGHLVFSTLHTNDAAGALTRLLDMGIEPYLVSSSLNGIIAQRLVRLVCPECRVEYRPSPEEVAELGLRAQDGLRFYRGAGCAKCLQSGYRGRTAIYELLLVSDAIRALIARRADAASIRREAIGQGMIVLREDGARKVQEGLTTVEEVLRVTQDEAE